MVATCTRTGDRQTKNCNEQKDALPVLLNKITLLELSSGVLLGPGATLVRSVQVIIQIKVHLLLAINHINRGFYSAVQGSTNCSRCEQGSEISTGSECMNAPIDKNLPTLRTFVLASCN